MSTAHVHLIMKGGGVDVNCTCSPNYEGGVGVDVNCTCSPNHKRGGGDVNCTCSPNHEGDGVGGWMSTAHVHLIMKGVGGGG